MFFYFNLIKEKILINIFNEIKEYGWSFWKKVKIKRGKIYKKKN